MYVAMEICEAPIFDILVHEASQTLWSLFMQHAHRRFQPQALESIVRYYLEAKSIVCTPYNTNQTMYSKILAMLKLDSKI